MGVAKRGFTFAAAANFVKQPQLNVGVNIAHSHSVKQTTLAQSISSKIQSTTSHRKALWISIQVTETLDCGSVTKYFSPGYLVNSAKQMATLEQAFHANGKRGGRALLGCSSHDVQHAIPIFITTTDVLFSADDLMVKCSYKFGFPTPVNPSKALVSAFKRHLKLRCAYFALLTETA
jgi:hypothetical protein